MQWEVKVKVGAAVFNEEEEVEKATAKLKGKYTTRRTKEQMAKDEEEQKKAKEEDKVDKKKQKEELKKKQKEDNEKEPETKKSRSGSSKVFGSRAVTGKEFFLQGVALKEQHPGATGDQLWALLHGCPL